MIPLRDAFFNPLMKDNFSKQSNDYARFRPDYPDALLQYILAQTAHYDVAWDCGTGNGQLAVMLAPHFRCVYATDISDAQLQHAPPHQNIIYKKEPAEHSAFPDKHFDLITVAQAIHWFDFEAFYKEVHRTLKDDGIFVATGYTLFCVNPEIDLVLYQFYTDVVGPYWDKERHYVDERYQSIPFPFEEIKAPPFYRHYEWTFPMLLGYLSTWSAVQHYIQKNGEDPVALVEPQLRSAWGAAKTHAVSFPILLRMGRKHCQQLS